MHGLETIKKMNANVKAETIEKSHNNMIIREHKDQSGVMHGWQFVKSEGYEETAKYNQGMLEFSRIKTPERIKIRGYKNGQKIAEVIRRTDPLMMEAIDDMIADDMSAHADIINQFSRY